jgi:2-(1,2-epoxy-1,2-dihydrophenyl)acetyl-CoA isomerase
VTLTLNRPEVLNALDDALYAALAARLREIAVDDAVRCVVLTGTGRGFCAGADIGAMDPQAEPAIRRARHRRILADILRPLATLEKPVIAAVNGVAAGAGFSLALAADIVVASEEAAFTLSFSRLAVIPDLGALHFLTRVVGLHVAKELSFTGRKITAAEARDLRIVNRVVPADQLGAEAGRLAAELAAGAPMALAQIKTLLNRASTMTLEDLLELEAYAQAFAYTTSDYREAVAAFRARRPPAFGTPRTP